MWRPNERKCRYLVLWTKKLARHCIAHRAHPWTLDNCIKFVTIKYAKLHCWCVKCMNGKWKWNQPTQPVSKGESQATNNQTNLWQISWLKVRCLHNKSYIRCRQIKVIEVKCINLHIPGPNKKVKVLQVKWPWKVLHQCTAASSRSSWLNFTKAEEL